jgi:hypothetical protein
MTPAIELLTVSCPSAKRNPGAAFKSTATTEMWNQCSHERGSFCLDIPRIIRREMAPSRLRRKAIPIGVKDSKASSIKRKDDPHTSPRAMKPRSQGGGVFTAHLVLVSPADEAEAL